MSRITEVRGDAFIDCFPPRNNNNRGESYMSMKLRKGRKGQFAVAGDGHYVGEDGFVVPRNFDELYERYPKYVLNWAKKRLNRFTVDEDVEDYTQDLLIYLKFSPARSFNRGEADKVCCGVIEAFDPGEQGGASEPIFRRYLNAALAQLFNAIVAKRQGHDIPPDREGYSK
jgi:hypothetical protein